MICTARSAAKSFLAPFFILGFLLALQPAGAAAQQGCNPPLPFTTPVLSAPAGCPLYLDYARLDYLGVNTDASTSVLAVADFNGDGKMDMLVAFAGGASELAVFLGNGDGTFQGPFSLGGICCSPDLRGLNWAVVGDFNGDGKPDVAAATSTGYVIILLGDGSGHFSLGQNFGVTAYGGSIAGAVADFNGDGKLDLLVADNHPNPGVAYVYLGKGDGTFQTSPTVINLASGDSPSALTTGDFNGDGKLDFAVTNIGPGGFTATVSVVFGNGDGTFATPVDYSTGTQTNAGSIPRSIVAADFNNDGYLDLATLDDGNSEISVLINNGNGTFRGPTFYGSWNNSGDGAFPQQLAATDLNRDGKIDLVAVASPQFGAGMAVLFGKGDGTFQPPVFYATDIQASSIAVGDFNGDGAPDVAVSSGPLATLAVLMNKGDGTLIGNRNYGNNGPAPVSVAFGDFDRDGKADMVVADNAGLNAIVYRNNGDGTFTESATYRTDPTDNGFGPNLVAVADLRHNGTLDLIAALSSGGSSISTLLGNGDGTFQPAQLYNPGLGGATVLAVADVNGDGIPDVVFNGTNATTGANPYVLYVGLGNGGGNFQSPQGTSDICQSPGFGPVIAVAVADVNGDGKPDILASCSNNAGTYPANIFLLSGNGDGTFGTPTAVPAGIFPTFISAADLNGDGRPDLVVGNNGSAGPTFSILLGNGDGTFQSPVSYSDVDSPFWTNWSAHQLSGYGNPGPTPYPQAVAVGDFNGDGHLDLLVADISGQIGGGSNGGFYNNGVQLFPGNGDGTFQAEQSYLACWHGQAIAAADLTGSGVQSAALACPSDGVVSVLINQLGTGNGKTATTTALQSSLNPSTFGQSVTLTATVTPAVGSGTPTGTVTFTDGSITLGTGTLSSAQATLTLSALALGSHSITASYGSDSNFLASTSTSLSQVINQGSSSTTLESSVNPSSVGQSVTFTAKVAASSGSGTPAGTVTFYDGTSSIGTGTLSAGKATLTTSALAFGSHSITAVYDGDSNFTGSTSAVLTQVVSKTADSTSLQSSLNPSTYGQSVSFTATIAWSGPGTPTGTVTFMDGASSLGTSALAGSKAILTTAALVAGSHSITASYSGDGNFAGSTSPALTQNVSPAATSTIIVSSANPAVFGQTVTFTATVTPTAAGTPGGMVTFMDGTATLGSSPLNASAQATFNTTSLTAGSHSISASFGGNANFAGSKSSTLTEQISSFSITASPATRTVNQGMKATYGLVLTPINGFVGTVTLSCGGAPAAATCTESPASVSLKGSTSNKSTATVTTTAPKKGNPGTPTGTYTLTFTATSGTDKQTVTVTLSVN